MPKNMDIRQIRGWMYNRLTSGRKGFTDAFLDGVDEFVSFACQQADLCSGHIRCPCSKCRNLNFLDPDDVKVHLYRKGFKPDYWYWTCHGERDPTLHVVCNTCPSTSSTAQEGHNGHFNRFESKVYDTAVPEYPMHPDQKIVESPNKDAQRFYDLPDLAEKPLLKGCSDHTEQLSTEQSTPPPPSELDVAGMKEGEIYGIGLEPTVVNRNYHGSSSSSEYEERSLNN